MENYGPGGARNNGVMPVLNLEESIRPSISPSIHPYFHTSIPLLSKYMFFFCVPNIARKHCDQSGEQADKVSALVETTFC